MHMLGRVLALLLLALVAAAAAQAGPPGAGDLLCTSAQILRFVHDTDGDGIRDPGENTTCAAPEIDSSANPPVVTDGPGGTRCVPASTAQVRSLATLIGDENAFDNDKANDGSAFTLLLDVRAQDKVFTIADSFVNDSEQGLVNLVLGNWDFRLFDETPLFTVGFDGALFLTPPGVAQGAFDQIRARLKAIAGPTQLNLVPDPTKVEPVIVEDQRDAARKRFDQSSATGCDDGGGVAGCGQGEADESGTSLLASVAQYRVTIHYVETIDTTQQTPCTAP